MEENNVAVKQQDGELESKNEDPGGHWSLISSMMKLHRRQQHYYQRRSEVSFNASEFTFSNDSRDNISVGDLVRGICHSTGIRNRLHSASEKKKSIRSPLPSVYTNEIQRSISYKKSSEKVDKWGAVVKHNREAMHMKFPIQEESISLPSLSNKVETFEPLHHYEKMIAAEITRSDMHDNHHHDEGESKLSEVNLKEVKQRRKELMKMRAQMSYLEAKRRRMKKIRSKRFHRVQRRHQSTKACAVLPDIVEKAEKLRAKERMTLKHTSKAKWAKKQLTKKTKDPIIQQALSEHYQRKEKLTRNIESESDDSDCAEFTQESGDNPWIETKERRTINADGIHIRTSDYMQAGGFMINSDTEFGTFQANIHEAFSGDDVTQQFKEERFLTSDAKKEVSQGALPGWGSWGGEGSKQKSLVHHWSQNKPSSSNLRNVNKEHVVVNELQDKKLAKHLVTTVPWPYTSLQQFEKTHCTPLGQHWNTEAIFHRLIKPQIMKTKGVRIEPLKLTDDIEDFVAVIQRTKHVVGK